MPLNEAAGVKPSNLTPAQRRAAEAAIFGVPAPEAPPRTRDEREAREAHQAAWARSLLSRLENYDPTTDA